ncbi:MAG: hypothetical protein HZB76_05525 [Chlamydiae bacterium]|nr:hypothetical protein [Chlamydiota bacterium]
MALRFNSTLELGPFQINWESLALPIIEIGLTAISIAVVLCSRCINHGNTVALAPKLQDRAHRSSNDDTTAAVQAAAARSPTFTDSGLKAQRRLLSSESSSFEGTFDNQSELLFSVAEGLQALDQA